MNTKLNKIKISPEFEDLFSFSNKEEEAEHRAQMISYRVLSEIEKICESKNLKKKDLAEIAGTSRSYITQLFRGDKQVNMTIMAKLEMGLEISFDIKISSQQDELSDSTDAEFTKEDLRRLKSLNPGWNFYAASKGGMINKTDQLLEEMQIEEESISQQRFKVCAL